MWEVAGSSVTHWAVEWWLCQVVIGWPRFSFGNVNVGLAIPLWYNAASYWVYALNLLVVSVFQFVIMKAFVIAQLFSMLCFLYWLNYLHCAFFFSLCRKCSILQIATGKTWRKCRSIRLWSKTSKRSSIFCLLVFYCFTGHCMLITAFVITNIDHCFCVAYSVDLFPSPELMPQFGPVVHSFIEVCVGVESVIIKQGWGHWCRIMFGPLVMPYHFSGPLQSNLRNCCHRQPDFQVNNAPNLTSAGAPPYTLLGSVYQTHSQLPEWNTRPHYSMKPLTSRS